MVRASSVIGVDIVGDPRKLQKATRDATKATNKMAGSMKKAAVGIGATFAGIFALSKVNDFAQSSLNEFDRLGDATARLDRLIGEVNTKQLAEIAKGFTKIGLSKQDVLELAANFASIGTAARIHKDTLANFADDVAATAQAMALLDPEGRDAAFFVDQIGKAAAGATKPLKVLGISLSDAEVKQRALLDTGKKHAKNLTDGELATARLKLALEKLLPVLQGATEGTADLEQAQADLNARIETLQGEIGANLQPIILDFLEGLDLVIDKFPEFSKSIHDNFVAGAAEFERLFGSVGEDIDQLIGWLNDINAAGSQLVADLTQDFKEIIDGIEAIGSAGGDLAETLWGVFDSAANAVKPLFRQLDDVWHLIQDILGGLGRIDFTSPLGLGGLLNDSDSKTGKALRREQERNGNLQRAQGGP